MSEDNIGKYPKTNEEINVVNYHSLVLKVYSDMVAKFGPWIHNHKRDLVQTGYIGLLKAKEKYTPGRGSFLGLAYLRIMSAMQNDIAKHARYEVNTTPLEQITGHVNHDDAGKLNWDEMFSGEILDYETLIRLVSDPKDKALLFGIIEMYPYWKLRAILKESKDDHDARVESLKKEMKDLLEILHPTL